MSLIKKNNTSLGIKLVEYLDYVDANVFVDICVVKNEDFNMDSVFIGDDVIIETIGSICLNDILTKHFKFLKSCYNYKIYLTKESERLYIQVFIPESEKEGIDIYA